MDIFLPLLLISKLDLSATKIDFENRLHEVERVAQSEKVPNWHVFVSIFGQEIEEMVEKYSQRGYCSSTITFFKPFLRNKN